MKKFSLTVVSILFLFSFVRKKPKIPFPKLLQKTNIAKLANIDSLCYYQCYCAATGNPPSYLVLAEAKKIKAPITVTEKFVLNKNGNNYRLRYYSSSLTPYPNKKYAYLKLKEKEYWDFKLKADTIISNESVFKLAALELKFRQITETYFNVVNDNYPQIILNGKKVSVQCVIEGNYLIRRELSELQKFSF